MVKQPQPPQFQKKNRQVRQVKQPRRQPPKRTMDAWDILEWQGQEAWNMV